MSTSGIFSRTKCYQPVFSSPPLLGHRDIGVLANTATGRRGKPAVVWKSLGFA